MLEGSDDKEDDHDVRNDDDNGVGEYVGSVEVGIDVVGLDDVDDVCDDTVVADVCAVGAADLLENEIVEVDVVGILHDVVILFDILRLCKTDVSEGRLLMS